MTLVVLSCWIFVVLVSRQPGHMAVVQFLAASAVMVLAAAVVVWNYHRHSAAIGLRWILFSAVLLRLISLWGMPLFEDDYYRYLWDGYHTAVFNDPYSLAPAEFFDREDYPEIFDPMLSLINYPEVATVYGPVTQWVFAVGYLIAPAEIWPLQLMAGLADFAVLVVLYNLGAGRALLFYAWSPLLLKEFSLTAHPDIYAILALMLSIFFFNKNRICLAGVALALAVGAKVFAVLVVPFLLSQRWSVRDWLWLCGFFALTIGLITVAFGTPAIWVPEGLQAMADTWLFNSAVYLMLVKLFDFQLIKLALLALFSMVVAVVCAHRLLMARARSLPSGQSVPAFGTDNTLQGFSVFRGDLLFLFFLLSLPVVNAWYVAWLLPFATIHPRWWSWAASYFCLLSYCTASNFGRFGPDSLELPAAVIAFEYMAVVVVAVLALAVARSVRYRAFTGW